MRMTFAVSNPSAATRREIEPVESTSLDAAVGGAISAEASSAHVDATAPLTPTLRRRRVEPRASAERRHRAPPRRAIVAVCSLTLVCLTLAGRERIVTRLPMTDRVFAAIGLPVNLAGVDFRNVASKVTEIDGQKVLAVTGEVVNLRMSASTTLPALTLTARGADGRALYVWTTAATTSKLGPGETATFRSRLAAPPEEAREVVVALAEPAKQFAQAEPAKSKESKGKPAAK